MSIYNLETLKKQYPDDNWSWQFDGGCETVEFNELQGKTIVEIHGMEIGNDVIFFVCDDGTIYKMYHEQNCCESVDINDICGEIDFLLNTPITLAEEVIEDGGEDDYGDSSTWTFYNFGTVKGYLTIRWYGESNGYYSESVDFIKCLKPYEES